MNSRITVVEHVYHESKKATCVSSRYTMPASMNKRKYENDVVAGPDWQELDFGWVDEVELAVLKNTEGSGLQVQPTPEEIADIALRTIELGVGEPPVPFARVKSGTSARFQPHGKLFIRCLHGKAQCEVHAIPS